MSARPSRLSDLDSICAIAAGSPFAARWSRAQYEAEIGSQRGLLAVWDDGQIRGYFVMLKVLDESQLVDLAVRPQDQGRGLGRALLEHAANTARAWGCVKMTLEVSAANEPALRLYRRAGFQVVGRRRNFYNYMALPKDGCDALLMDLPLA